MLPQLVVSGLALGSMYGLVALGYHITWATTRTMNFSQGHAVMAGAVIAYGLHVALGWPLAAAVVGMLLATAGLGVAVERVAIRPFFRSASLVWLLSTIACGIIGENLAMLALGKDARALPSALTEKPVLIGGAGVYPQELLLPVVGLVLRGAVQAFYHRTTYGKRLKAVAFNPEAASLVGIHIPRATNLRLAAPSRPAFQADLPGVLERFPALGPRLDDPAGALSGGQQQMLALARGLIARPRLLLLDEPSLGLAPKLVRETFDTIRAIRAAGVSILLVEQMAAMALGLADRGYVLERGRIVAEGRAADLGADPAIMKAYLGARRGPAGADATS